MYCAKVDHSKIVGLQNVDAAANNDDTSHVDHITMTNSHLINIY